MYRRKQLTRGILTAAIILAVLDAVMLTSSVHLSIYFSSVANPNALRYFPALQDTMGNGRPECLGWQRLAISSSL